MLLAFLCVGMLCGEDGILGISFNDYQLTENVCTAALILIIFYGGFGTKWKCCKARCRTSHPAFYCWGVSHCGSSRRLLSHRAARWAIGKFADWLCHQLYRCRLCLFHLACKKAELEILARASLALKVESGSNDPIAYLMVTIVVAMMETSVSAGSVLYQVFAQIVFGVGIGAALALVVLFFLRRFQFDTSGFDLVFMLAVAILSYVVPTMIGGNGYLSAYIAGIILGNAELSNKKNLVHFFDGVTGLMQLLVFFILGMLCTPTKLIGVLLPALGIAIFFRHSLPVRWSLAFY